MEKRLPIFRFDDVRVEAAEFRVFKNGKIVSLEPKALTLLLFLLENGGRLVTRDELLDAIWKDSFVTPNALTRLIAQLRRVLGDDPEKPHYIQTVPTKGYRFIAPVERSGTADESVPARSGRTIAVLPFEILGTATESGEKDYLGLGLADSLITRLSGIGDLTVRPTSSVLHYTGEVADAFAAGRELRVETVLEGAIQRSGERIRVTVRLIDIRNEKMLRADIYDADFIDIFQVQDEISIRITETLRLHFSEIERRHLVHRPTEDIGAYRFCLHGNYFLYRMTPGDLEKALNCFREALTLDPACALAYAGLAGAYGIMSSSGNDPAAAEAETAAMKAVELDPTLAEAFAMLGAIRFWNSLETDRAREDFQRAFELNPGSVIVRHYYGWFLIAAGCFEEAAGHLARALEIDPLSVFINVDQGLPFFFTGRFKEAAALYARALELDENSFYPHLRMAEAYEGLHEFELSIGEFERALALSENNPSVRTLLARTLALAGRKPEAVQLLGEVTGGNQANPPHYFIALARLALGETGKALDSLEDALAGKDKWLGWAKVDPRLAPLRRDKKFSGFLRRAGLEPGGKPSSGA